MGADGFLEHLSLFGTVTNLKKLMFFSRKLNFLKERYKKITHRNIRSDQRGGDTAT